MSLQDELLDQERAFWGAGGDADFYREHFADDGHCVFAVGILDKDAVLQAIAAGAPWTDLQVDEVSVAPIGDDAAAIAYRASALPEGGDVRYETYVSSVYVRRDGRWQLFLHQHVPPA
ncbi:nuclear transport factor 2 family protein [Egicoccus sp. AB-alg2]|uniref:nuclear transport factor 2 family protein n=1 Tax=Egicoccus sp. AB-alg2 TaxID=3242693 RepID=UPI00359E59B5